MRIDKACLVAVIAGVGITFAAAQDPVFQVRVDVPLVSVDVRVNDSRGQPVTTLAKEDFVLVEDGLEQQIQAFSSVDTPYNILLLFDRSGSTQDQWSFMQRAASRFMSNLRKQDSLALGAFDEGLMMLSNWSDPLKEVEKALNELPKRGPGGGTNLYQSLERATQREFRNTTGRRALIVLSDGRDTTLARQRGSGTADPVFARTYSIVQKTRIPLYFVALNTDKNPAGGYVSNSVVIEARTRMELLANVSGGGIFFPKSIRDIVDVYDQVSRDLSSSYTLAYTSSNPSISGQTHRIEVRTHGAKVKQSRETYVTP
jgi:Ca-activated chloride channel family protein